MRARALVNGTKALGPDPSLRFPNLDADPNQVKYAIQETYGFIPDNLRVESMSSSAFVTKSYTSNPDPAVQTITFPQNRSISILEIVTLKALLNLLTFKDIVKLSEDVGLTDVEGLKKTHIEEILKLSSIDLEKARELARTLAKRTKPRDYDEYQELIRL